MLTELLAKKTSDTVFIIGGGSSLAKYLPDVNILNGKDIICTNNAYKIFPNSLALFFMDKSWFEAQKKTIKALYQGIVTTADNTQKKFFIENGVKHVFLRGIDRGISEAPDKLNGCNSGHLAINLAINMGYTRIVLIGFDMDSKAPTTHWHSDHPEPTNRERYDKVFLPSMSTIVPFQEKLGFKIYNINKESCIKDFEFADLENFL